MNEFADTLLSDIYSYSESPKPRRRSSRISLYNTRDIGIRPPLTPRAARRTSLADGMESPKSPLRLESITPTRSRYPGSFEDPEDNPQHHGLSFLFRSIHQSLNRLLILYILWHVLSHVTWRGIGKAREFLKPQCTDIVYGDTIPIYCPLPLHYSKPHALDFVTSFASIQGGLGDVVASATKSHEMARDIASYGFALRDLKIRVAASSLKKKKELTRELIELIKYTDEAVWYDPDFIFPLPSNSNNY